MQHCMKNDLVTNLDAIWQFAKNLVVQIIRLVLFCVFSTFGFLALISLIIRRKKSLGTLWSTVMPVNMYILKLHSESSNTSCKSKIGKKSFILFIVPFHLICTEVWETWPSINMQPWKFNLQLKQTWQEPLVIFVFHPFGKKVYLTNIPSVWKQHIFKIQEKSW